MLSRFGIVCALGMMLCFQGCASLKNTSFSETKENVREFVFVRNPIMKVDAWIRENLW